MAQRVHVQRSHLHSEMKCQFERRRNERREGSRDSRPVICTAAARQNHNSKDDEEKKCVPYAHRSGVDCGGYAV